MNPQVWWYLARSSGIVAWLFLTAAVLWGIVLATDLFPESRRPAWLLDLHRWLGGLTVTFVAVHIAALVADSYIEFSLTDIAVPFASEYQTTAIAYGVLAAWGLVAVQATSLARKHLSQRIWRGVHRTSAATFWLTSLHGTYAGTDARNQLYAISSVVAMMFVLVALTYRIATRKTPRQARQPEPPSGEGAPVQKTSSEMVLE